MKTSAFTLIDLPVVVTLYCRCLVKNLYNRCGMQFIGGGALAGNTMNTEKTGGAENGLYCPITKSAAFLEKRWGSGGREKTLFPGKEVFRFPQLRPLHFDRTAGCDCDPRHPRLDAHAGFAEGAGDGEKDIVSCQFERDWLVMAYAHDNKDIIVPVVVNDETRLIRRIEGIEDTPWTYFILPYMRVNYDQVTIREDNPNYIVIPSNSMTKMLFYPSTISRNSYLGRGSYGMLRYCIGGIRYSKKQSYMQRTPAKFSLIRMASGKAMIMDSACNANDPDIITGVDSTSEGNSGSFQVYNSGKNGLGETEPPPLNVSAGFEVGYHCKEGKNGIRAFDWEQYYNFADKVFRHPK